ncbi:MAG: hypothetical protein N3F67_03100 [Acidilobaceae archaeon]|nr:hypothetical protein [Acidilobaceae archaeon]
MGLAVALALGPGWTSFAFVGALIAYVAASFFFPETRYLPLSLLVGIHVGAVISYYTRPVPLPFFIVELSPYGPLLNIDVVQLLVAYELASYYMQRRANAQGAPAASGAAGGEIVYKH